MFAHARRRVALLLAALLTVAGLAGATALPASATITGSCGTGYTELGAWNAFNQYGTVVGRLYVMRNTSVHKVCAVFDKMGYMYGAASETLAEVSSTNGVYDLDVGTYSYYAGPVYITCNGYPIWGYGSEADGGYTREARSPNINVGTC